MVKLPEGLNGTDPESEVEEIFVHVCIGGPADICAVRSKDTVGKGRAAARPFRVTCKGSDNMAVLGEHLGKVESHHRAGEAGEAADTMILTVFRQDLGVVFPVFERSGFLVKLVSVEREAEHHAPLPHSPCSIQY